MNAEELFCKTVETHIKNSEDQREKNKEAFDDLYDFLDEKARKYEEDYG